MNGNQQQLIFSLGGNETATESCFTKSLELLSLRFGIPTHLSSVFCTEAWGFASSAPEFLNQIVVFNSSEDPFDILSFSQQIEKSLGRKNKSISKIYTNRSIDIDILFYGTITIQTKNLSIPHPLLHERNFILEPLNEILPNFLHPTLKKTVKELLLSTQDNSTVKVYKK